MRDKKGRFIKGNISWSKLHPECMRRGKNHPMFGKKLSKKHRKILSKIHKGKPSWNKGIKMPQFSRENSGHWSGGKTIKGGRVFIYKPKHPFANQRGYVRHSHIVMEKHLGRYLEPTEVIHHINGIKDDDRPENLKLFANNSEHCKFHNHNKSRNKFGRFL